MEGGTLRFQGVEMKRQERRDRKKQRTARGVVERVGTERALKAQRLTNEYDEGERVCVTEHRGSS